MVPKAEQKLIYLKWQDAYADGGWCSEKGLIDKINNEAFICEEVGWLVFEDDKEIHLCGRRGSWDKKTRGISEYGMYQRIPRTWILERKVIQI